jgi:hypothetical protein
LLLGFGLHLSWLLVAMVGCFYQIEPGRFGSVDTRGMGYRQIPCQAVDIWCRWDADFYLRIAAQGYGDSVGSLRAAFFPLYPACIRLLHQGLGIPWLWAGLGLANLFDGLAWLGLAAFFRLRLAPRQAQLAWLAFAIFPTRNFGFSIYSEGLFLLLSVGAFLAWEKRRFGLAGLCCALVSATRPQGICVGAALGLDALWAAFQARRQQQPVAVAPLFAAAAGLLGMGAYMVFLQQRFADPLAFLHLQQVWRRSLSLPWTTLLAHGEPLNHLVLWGAGLGWVQMLRRRAPVRDCAYVALSLLGPLLSGSVQSTPRFVGMLFPLFEAAGRVDGRRGNRFLARLGWRLYWPTAVIFCLIMAFKLGQGGRVV